MPPSQKKNGTASRRHTNFFVPTYDPQGFPKNFDVGHGWWRVDLMLPVESEFYHSGLGVEALRPFPIFRT